MRNRGAEWILSLAVQPEEARTIIGDLIEAQPGPVVFWRSVLGATASIASNRPRRALTIFFIFAMEFDYLACGNWVIFTNPKHLYPIVISNSVLAFIVSWTLVYRRKFSPSALAFGVNFGWLFWHSGVALLGVVLGFVVTILGWCFDWQRTHWNADPQSADPDHPVAQ